MTGLHRRWLMIKLLAGAVRARRISPFRAVWLYRLMDFRPPTAEDLAWLDSCRRET